MKLCLDVDYRDSTAVAACVGFEDWTDAAGALERTMRFDTPPAEYRPGEFYRREMPYLLTLVESIPAPIELVIVDGYVWLDGGRPGLGAHLYEALGRRCAVIGVAKRPFRGASHATPVLRGSSKLPLFVSAVGIDLAQAESGLLRMHGLHRIPTLLKRVDRLARE